MLTIKQLTEIEALQKLCEEGTDFQLKLNWDILQSREDDKVNDFFYYEDGMLVGFLGLYGFGSKVELCGMVAPSHRRKGIFNQLFKRAEIEIKKRKFQEILLNTPSSSNSGKLFLKTIPCFYSFSEYQMKWNTNELPIHNEVTLRPSTDNDMDLEINLDVSCFGLEEEDARIHLKHLKEASSDNSYIIDYESKSVGKLRINHSNSDSWIYGFAVLPSFQGQGIGRKALTHAIQKGSEQGNSVFLEVEAKNENALHLYESCGFESYQAQDYYQLIME